MTDVMLTDRAESGASPAGPTVMLRDVSKWYGDKVAVAGMSLDLWPGITGLLGPNGAGKTTLIRLITGLISPSQGAVRVHGGDPRRDAGIRSRIGLVPEDEAVPSHLSARGFAELRAALFGLDDPPEAAQTALAAVGLTDVADRRLGTYSKGMRQRAKLAASLVAGPTVVVLDEPLNGTDPRQRAALLATFTRLGAEGRTVLVSSHVLAEVERLTDRVVAMVDGRLAAVGPVEGIRAAMSSRPRRIRVGTDQPRELGAALLADGAVTGVVLTADGLEVSASDPLHLAHLLPRTARRLDVRLASVEPQEESLATTFRDLVAGGPGGQR